MTNENIQTALYVGTFSLGLIGHLIEVKRLQSERDLARKLTNYWIERHDDLRKECSLFNFTGEVEVVRSTMTPAQRQAELDADLATIRYVKMHPPTTSILSFPCPHCEHQFGSKKALDAHVSQKHDPFGFTCVCGRFFSSKQGLGRHLLACKGTGTCTLSK